MEMTDSSYVAISDPSRSASDLKDLSWATITRNSPFNNNIQREQHVLQPNISVQSHPQAENRDFSFTESLQQGSLQAIDRGMEGWDPMDEDFVCPEFNSYKSFDILKAENPSERSPEKTARQSPEKHAEEISLYVANVPLSIKKEGIKNLFSSVGVVLDCMLLPPRDPSSDTKYGFVRFATWREAIRAIETYNGFYVGCGQNLIVKLANRKRDDDEYCDYNFSDTMAEEQQTTNFHPSYDVKYRFDDEDVSDKNPDRDSILISEVDQKCQKDRAKSDDTTHDEKKFNEYSANGINNVAFTSESTCITNGSPSESELQPTASTRPKNPCTNCQKMCTQRCSACKAPYCSRNCQKEDRARHKLTCKYPGFKKSKPKIQPPSPPPKSHHNFDSDSDFDCIDISVDATPMRSRVDSHSKVELGKSLNMTHDSGYTSQKEYVAYQEIDTVNDKEDAALKVPCGHNEDISNESKETLRVEKLNAIFQGMSLRRDVEVWQLDKVYVSAVRSPNMFWAVARTPEYSRFCELTAKMIDLHEKDLEPVKWANVGAQCLTRFSVDKCWYRARINQANGGSAEVIFVDYGNKELKHVDELYQLPLGFDAIPPQAKLFSLSGVKDLSDVGIEQLVVQELESLTCGRIFMAEVVSHSPGCAPEVILRGDDPSKPSINETVNNYILHHSRGKDNPLFPVSLKETGKSYPRRPRTTSPVPPESPKPTASMEDQLSCAPNSFHDASVSIQKAYKTRENSRATGTYGVPGGISLSEDPPSRGLCDKELIGTSSNHVQYFVNTNSQSQSSGVHPIQKPRMACDVPYDVLPSTQSFDVFICHYVNPSLFWVWCVGTAKRYYTELSSIISATYEQSTYTEFVPTVGELIVARFSDGAWYRARVDRTDGGSMISVSFVDFGNSDTVRVSDCRRITDRLASFPKLARKCALHGGRSFTPPDWSQECVRFAGNLLLNKRASASLIGRRDDTLLLEIRVDVDGEARSLYAVMVSAGLVDQRSQQTCPDKPTSAHFESLKNRVFFRHSPPDDKAAEIFKAEVGELKSVFPSGRPVSRDIGPSKREIDQCSLPEEDTPPELHRNSLRLPDRFSGKTAHLSAQWPESAPMNVHTDPRANVLQEEFPVVRHTVHQEQMQEQRHRPTSVTQEICEDARVSRAVTNPLVSSTSPSHPDGIRRNEQAAKAFSLSSIPAPRTSNQPCTSGPEDGRGKLPLNSSNVTSNRKPLSTFLRPVVPKTPFEVSVNLVVSGDRFFAQMIDEGLLRRLHESVRELNEYVSKTNPPMAKDVEFNSLGCARFRVDNIWYRAQVIKVQDKTYRVRFVDFGNIQNVSPAEFLQIPRSFFELPPLCLCCRLGPPERIWGNESQNLLQTLILNKRFACIALSELDWGKMYCVKLQYDAGDRIVDIAEELEKGMTGYRSSQSACSGNSFGLSTARAPESSKKHEFRKTVLNAAILASGLGERKSLQVAKVVCASHPEYFWIQAAGKVSDIEQLHVELAEYYMSHSYPPFEPTVDTFCAYVNIIKRVACRAYVKEKKSDGYVIHLVDNGKLLTVSENRCRPLEIKFRDHFIGAVLCSMSDVVPCHGKHWSDEAIAFFREKVHSKMVKFQVVFKSQSRLFVRLYEPDSTSLLSKALVGRGLAKMETSFRTPSVLDEELDTSHDGSSSTGGEGSTVESPVGEGAFFMQKPRNPVHSEAKDIAPCAMDEKLTKLLKNALQLGDDGDSTQTSKQLNNFDHAPPRSRVEENASFRPTVTERAAFGNDRLLLTENHHVPSAHTTREDELPTIATRLPAGDEICVFVSWVDSTADCLWAQLAVPASAMEYVRMAERLNETCIRDRAVVVAHVQVGRCYAASFSGEWCRCKVEALLGSERARVFYVDFGNREVVDSKTLKPLPPEFRRLPAQALPCALAGVKSGSRGWTEDGVRWLKTRVLNKTFMASIVGRLNGVLQVYLYDLPACAGNVSVNTSMIRCGV